MHVRVSLKKFFPLFFVIMCLLVSACSTQTAASPPTTKKIVGAVIVHNITRSTGCGKVAPQSNGSSVNASLLSSGLSRSYRLHLPLTYQQDNPQPLVLNFHGHGSTDTIQEKLTGLSKLADQDDFIVAYPQGTVGADHRTGWNIGPANYPHVNDILFTNNLITHLEETLCINPDRIYASGFSNGGGMTNVLACKLSDRIAAFAIVSGAIHPMAGGCDPTRPVAILDFHGTHDSVVPYLGNPANDHEPPITQWLASWAKIDSCNSRPTIISQTRRLMTEQWTGCKGGVTIIHYRINNGIHIWPSPTTDRGTVNATPIIWSFLKNYSLNTGSNL
jgi:polyhydroxybutyrate depolymerase